MKKLEKKYYIRSVKSLMKTLKKTVVNYAKNDAVVEVDVNRELIQKTNVDSEWSEYKQGTEILITIKLNDKQ